jgi:outer membrane protein, heavy metal efflux system
MRSIFILLLFAVSSGTFGQSVGEFLNSVAMKNPDIIAGNKLLEARRIEARTGNTPPDPFISGGIMPGNSVDGGLKKIWGVSQSFSFPTKYLLQKKVNLNTVSLAEQEFNQGRLSVLLEAKLSAIELIYNQKTLSLLQKRKEGYDRLRDSWKKMLDNGATTIMDYNRILLELSELDLLISEKEAAILMESEKLMFMSASDTPPRFDEYPAVSSEEAVLILGEKSTIHPAWLIPVMEYELSVRELKLSKTGSLPEFQIGYQSEILPVEAYTGPTAGFSIPLWSNTNKVKSASAAAEHVLAHRDAEIFRLNSEFRKEYSRMQSLQKNTTMISGILQSGGGTKYIDTALAAGEISLVSYFSYLEELYRSEDRLMELEKDYQKSSAILFDHELLK